MIGRSDTNAHRGRILAALITLFALWAFIPAHAEATSVTFRFRPPEGAKIVTVAGTFNQWNSTIAPMADPDDDGLWETTLHMPPGTYQYKFVVNGTEWYHDKFASHFVADGFGGQNSVMQVGGDPMIVGDDSDSGQKKTGTEVTFCFAPEGHANAVSVAGSFNGWDAGSHAMRDEDGDGIWEITILLQPGEYKYQFVVDGDRWLGDPTARRHEKDDFDGRNALLKVGEQPTRVGACKR
jgi:1,4-alpha-glucan branching enzyme